MFKNQIATAVGILLAGCHSGFQLEISNPFEQDRLPEMIEIPEELIRSELSLEDDGDFVIIRGEEEIPYQITHDNKVIFQVIADAGEVITYCIRKGKPAIPVTKACGKHYPDKGGDISWENDKGGFRMYGHSNNVASGYDLFAKRNTELPMLESFYKNEVDGSPCWIRYEELMKTDSDAAYRYLMDTISYHVDKGFGMDCYEVGPTLGAGIAALTDNGKILYPYCYDSFEILDNGPLRFSIRLTFRPFDTSIDNDVIETRIITLDTGSYLNHTAVSYSGLTEIKEIVAGIILRDNGMKATADAGKGYISYPAPTLNADTTRMVDNGILYIGHVYPHQIKEAKEAFGHVMSFSEYTPDDFFEYYWGFGWDHSDVTSHEQWNKYLETFSYQLRKPLTINIK